MNIYQLQTVKLYMLYDTYQVYIYILYTISIHFIEYMQTCAYIAYTDCTYLGTPIHIECR